MFLEIFLSPIDRAVFIKDITEFIIYLIEYADKD